MISDSKMITIDGAKALRRHPSGNLEMLIKAMVLIACLVASYFVIVWVLSGYPGKALMTGVLAAPVFFLTLLAARLVTQNRPWRAFWIANAVLIVIFGGLELYAAHALRHSTATRFGGAHLSVDGHITAAGISSLFLDIGICTLSNFLGFSSWRLFLTRFSL